MSSQCHDVGAFKNDRRIDVASLSVAYMTWNATLPKMNEARYWPYPEQRSTKPCT